MAPVIVDQLDAVERSFSRARIGKALVDVTLAAGTDESWWTLAFESTDLVHAGSSMMTRSLEAFVDVDFAEDPQGSVRAGAGEGVDQIVADTAIAAGIGEAVVDVELAVGALESSRTGARVRSYQILAGSAILTRCRVAFVDFVLAVASGVTFGTDTSVTVADILTLAVMAAQISQGRSFTQGGVLAGHHFDIAKDPGPSGGAGALVRLVDLMARCSVEARTIGVAV